MLEKYSRYSEVINKFPAKLILIGMFAIGAVMVLKPEEAQALTADDVLNKMDGKEQYSYIAGVVGGLAYSRYLRDKPDKDGMNCIYDWYHADTKKAWGRIEAWFSRHKEKMVEPLLYVLIKKECGA